MAYCRFSDDQWQCDVYCYKDISGDYVIAVASHRHVFERLPPPPKNFPEHWLEHSKIVAERLKAGTLERIGLPYDGEFYLFHTARHAMLKLKELREAGYNVPEYAIQSLSYEAEEGEEEEEDDQAGEKCCC